MPQVSSFNYLPNQHNPYIEREVLTEARTYYVSTVGNDDLDGRTPATAFKTIQQAVDVVCFTLDMKDNQVTIQLLDGTYSSTVAVTLRLYVGTVTPIIQGNATTPANVIISNTSSNCFNIGVKTIWTVKDMQLTTTTSGTGLSAGTTGTIRFSNINFGACATFHMVCTSYGSIFADGNYAIVGASPIHHAITEAGYIQVTSRTVTITGTPAFSTAFVFGRTAAVLRLDGNTYSGAATGTRYNLTGNSVAFTNGAGATYLPGNVAGTTATGGQYT